MAGPSAADPTRAVPGGNPRRWTILGILAISLLAVALDNTVLYVALRALADPRQGLGASQSQLEWAINAYTLVFAGLLFSFGVLGDRYGRRRLLLVGLAVFGIASLACATAHDLTVLIAARALMGLGAAAIMPASLAIISIIFEPRDRGRAIGIWTGAIGIGVAIGPIVGGALLEHFWWGSVFLINVPVVLVAMATVAILVPESRNQRPGRLDPVGVLLSIAGLIALIYGIIGLGAYGLSHWPSWSAILGGLCVLIVFVSYERRIGHPALDVRLFTDPRFSAGAAVIGLGFFAGVGVFFFVTLYLQLARGLSPLLTGAALLPFALSQLVLGPMSSNLMRGFGARGIAAAGLALTCLAMIGYSFIRVQTTIWAVEALLLVEGAGLITVGTTGTLAIMSALPREHAAVGSAMSNTVRQIGSSLGIAVLGSLVASTYRHQMAAATAAMPGPLRVASGESFAGLHAAAAHLGASGQILIPLANDTFVTAIHRSALVAAAAAGAAVRLAWYRLPAPVTARHAAAPARKRLIGRHIARHHTDRGRPPIRSHRPV
jgi:EmrB/QacA subfamily drug resistance transporter